MTRPRPSERTRHHVHQWPPPAAFVVIRKRWRNSLLPLCLRSYASGWNAPASPAPSARPVSGCNFHCSSARPDRAPARCPPPQIRVRARDRPGRIRYSVSRPRSEARAQGGDQSPPRRPKFGDGRAAFHSRDRVAGSATASEHPSAPRFGTRRNAALLRDALRRRRDTARPDQSRAISPARERVQYRPRRRRCTRLRSRRGNNSPGHQTRERSPLSRAPDSRRFRHRAGHRFGRSSSGHTNRNGQSGHANVHES